MNVFAAIPGIYVLAFLSVTIHEAAHVVAGRFIGFAPNRVLIGTGRQMFRIDVCRVAVEVFLWPSGGLTFPSTLPRKGLRWRGPVFVLAGPFASAMLFASFLYAAFQSRWVADYQQLQTLMGLAAFVEGVQLLGNLIPRDATVHGLRTPNDIKQLLSYLSGNTQRVLQANLEAYRKQVSR